MGGRSVSYLNCSFHNQTKTTVTKYILFIRDSCDIIFFVKFNVEFTRQAMDFPKELYVFITFPRNY